MAEDQKTDLSLSDSGQIETKASKKINLQAILGEALEGEIKGVTTNDENKTATLELEITDTTTSEKLKLNVELTNEKGSIFSKCEYKGQNIKNEVASDLTKAILEILEESLGSETLATVEKVLLIKNKVPNDAIPGRESVKEMRSVRRLIQRLLKRGKFGIKENNNQENLGNDQIEALAS